MADRARPVTGGVDTHKDVHVTAVVDEAGRLLGSESFPATATGYGQLLAWLHGHGQVVAIGVEGTGSYGAGLARYLRGHDVRVIEVNRPDRRRRRLRGKSDPVDAECAARAALNGEATTIPKTQDGPVEAIRCLRVARRSAIKARTQAANQIHTLLDTAPEPLRARFTGSKWRHMIDGCSAFGPGANLADPTNATKHALAVLARRWTALDRETRALDTQLHQLLTTTAPNLIDRHGIGVDTAGALLVAAGDNPHRLTSEAAFAALCGVSPVEASSGRITRHRLNRGGNREANQALWRIVLVRMRSHQPTRDYVQRRTKQGRTKKEIIRCLKRYVAREIHRDLLTALSTQPLDNQ